MSRILIIDDEPAICWSLKEGLGDQGHEVQVAASIERAGVLLQAFTPDVIVLDVRRVAVVGRFGPPTDLLGKPGARRLDPSHPRST